MSMPAALSTIPSGACALSPTTLLLLILLGHLMASALLAALALPLRPSRLRDRWQRDYPALLGMALLVPLAGPLFMLLNLLLYRLLRDRKTSTAAQRLTLPGFVPDQPHELTKLGVGRVMQNLKEGTLDTDKSIRALMAVEQQRSGRTSQVLYDILSHADDSVRLTAAGLLNRRESRVQLFIRRVDRALENIPPERDQLRAELHMQAAKLNAEMLYLRLAREGMAHLYLERWDHHLNHAQLHFGNTPAWLISRARWLDQSGRDGSRELYRRALEADAAPARVLPYMAEHYWRQRDYAGIVQLVEHSNLFAALPVAGTVKKRWAREKKTA